MKAVWKKRFLAVGNDIIVLDNNHYFPMSSLDITCFNASVSQTICPWKGEASYYSIIVDGEENLDAAWYYPAPKTAAKQITNRIAFWKGVEIVS